MDCLRRKPLLSVVAVLLLALSLTISAAPVGATDEGPADTTQVPPAETLIGKIAENRMWLIPVAAAAVLAVAAGIVICILYEKRNDNNSGKRVKGEN